VNLWRYETDRGYGHAAVIYDGLTGSAKEIPALYKALIRHFGESCEFDFGIEGWSSNEQLLIKVNKALEDPSYEQHFCVQRPRLFIFDLTAKSLLPYTKP